MTGRRDPSVLTRFPVVDVEDLPEDLRERVIAVGEKSGFIPNVFLGIAQRPAEMRAFLDFHDSVMDRDTAGLSKADREMIVVATSAENDCLYCVVAHGAIARIRSKNPYIADQLAVDWRKADLDPRQHAVISAAVKLASTPSEIVDADLDALRDHGLSEEDVDDVGAITAFFSMSNRLVHWRGLRPNPEFYLMGRVPREQ